MAESEEGESAGSVIGFFLLGVNSLTRRIERHYRLQMIGIKHTSSNLVHDLGRLLLGSECFNGDFASNEGMRLSTECDFRIYMVNVSWLKPDFFRHAELDMG